MQNNWIKIGSYPNLFEAQMRQAFLKSANIDAVIVNARDSLFLIGDIDLYVKKEDKDKAENILLQFEGKTKINSFILEKPMILFQQFLKNKGIKSTLVRKQETEYILDNFEVYVINELLEKVKPYLTADELDDWILTEKCQDVKQTAYRVELLNDHSIDAMVIKKKDSDFHLQEVKIFTKKENQKKAKQLLENLPQWKLLSEYDTLQKAELTEDMLFSEGIKAIIKQVNNQYKIFVPEKDIQKATQILNLHKKPVKIKTYDSFINAQKDLALLQEAGIHATIITKKDSIFLLGEYYLFVDENDKEKALKILT